MIIQFLNGERIDVEQYGLKRLFHYIPSLPVEHSKAVVDGGREIITNTRLRNRQIQVSFIYESQDISDYYLIRDEVNNLFLREEPYYIIFKKEPYKKWLVKLSQQFQLPPDPKMQEFTIDFITVNRYAESISSTQDLKEWDADVWSWNGGISWDEDLSYEFNTNNFVVNNLGTAIVDPRESYLEIELTANSTSLLTLHNRTTDERWTYNGKFSTTDKIIISGIQSFKNGTSIFLDTNKELISLAPGRNVFSITGNVKDINVKFKFNFLYK